MSQNQTGNKQQIDWTFRTVNTLVRKWKNVSSIESPFQNVEPSLKFPIDETKPKITAEDAFEEKGVSSTLAVFQFTDYQYFDSRKKM